MLGCFLLHYTTVKPTTADLSLTAFETQLIKVSYRWLGALS
jgi:hypothetical protein